MRTLLVDDEPLALRRLEIMLARRDDVQVVGTARDGRAALEAIDALRPDLVLLDVRMPELNGAAVAETVARAGGPAIVFVTAYDAYAIDAFAARAVDYLLKPVEERRLFQAIDRARDAMNAQSAGQRVTELEGLLRDLEDDADADRADLWIRDRGRAVRVSQTEIEWIEAERDYVRIHVDGRSWLMRETMTRMTKRLDPELFVRVHRSAIVNARRVRMCTLTDTGARLLELASGVQVRVGRSYESAVADLTGVQSGPA